MRGSRSGGVGGYHNAAFIFSMALRLAMKPYHIKSGGKAETPGLKRGARVHSKEIAIAGHEDYEIKVISSIVILHIFLQNPKSALKSRSWRNAIDELTMNEGSLVSISFQIVRL